MAIALAALAGWIAVTLAGGGINPGDGLGGPGPTASAFALALGAPLAAAALIVAWGHPALRARATLIALAGAGGGAVWAGLSIIWADAPDLAWLDADRQAIAVCALVIGLCLGALLPRAPWLVGVGLAAGAAPAILLSLGSKVVPAALGSNDDPGRLSGTLGYWNALALLVALAVPGLLWLAGGPAAASQRRAALAGAGLAVAITTLMLTYSRGGLMAAALAAAVVLPGLRRRGVALAALAAGAIGAAWPSAFALRDPLLTGQIPVALRENAGLALGGRLLAGAVLAAVLAGVVAHRATRGARPPLSGRAAAAVLIGLCLVVVAATLATPAGRHWVGKRVDEFRGEGTSALANSPSRLTSTSGNQRGAWWAEAWRAFQQRPLIGQGAGGFGLVHTQWRHTVDDTLATNEAHGVIARTLSGTGLIGLALLAALAGAVGWAVIGAAAGRAGGQIVLPLAVLAAFALQTNIDWSWAIPALTIPAFLAAGVVLASAAPGGPAARRRPGGAAVGLTAALVAAAIVAAIMPWWADQALLRGEKDLATGDPAGAVAEAQTAFAADPLLVRPALLRARAYQAMHEPARALGAYRAATRLQPANPETWRALALFLDVGKEADAAWTRVHALDPQDPEAALRARP